MTSGPNAASHTPQHLAQKLLWVSRALQLMALAYLLWVLWEIFLPVRDPALILNWMGRLTQHGLTQVRPWQLNSYLAVDLLTWALLAWAVACCWQAMDQIRQPNGKADLAARQLIVGAWLGLATEAASVLARPLKSYLLTCCNENAQALIHWFLRPQDLLAIILCLSMLGLAYVFSWKTLLAEENKEFV